MVPAMLCWPRLALAWSQQTGQPTVPAATAPPPKGKGDGQPLPITFKTIR